MGEDRKQQKLLTHGCVTAKEVEKSKKGKVMMSHSYIHADKLKFPSSLGAAKRPDFKTDTHTRKYAPNCRVMVALPHKITTG